LKEQTECGDDDGNLRKCTEKIKQLQNTFDNRFHDLLKKTALLRLKADSYLLNNVLLKFQFLEILTLKSFAELREFHQRYVVTERHTHVNKHFRPWK